MRPALRVVIQRVLVARVVHAEEGGVGHGWYQVWSVGLLAFLDVVLLPFLGLAVREGAAFAQLAVP